MDKPGAPRGVQGSGVARVLCLLVAERPAAWGLKPWARTAMLLEQKVPLAPAGSPPWPSPIVPCFCEQGLGRVRGTEEPTPGEAKVETLAATCQVLH